MADARLETARKHLAKAQRYFHNREKPDPENAVKEAVCAVEAAARELFPDSKPSDLNEAVKSITGTEPGELPPAIAKTFIGLYAFRGGGGGRGTRRGSRRRGHPGNCRVRSGSSRVADHSAGRSGEDRRTRYALLRFLSAAPARHFPVARVRIIERLRVPFLCHRECCCREWEVPLVLPRRSCLGSYNRESFNQPEFRENGEEWPLRFVCDDCSQLDRDKISLQSRFSGDVHLEFRGKMLASKDYEGQPTLRRNGHLLHDRPSAFFSKTLLR
jgi:hypothetical protein